MITLHHAPGSASMIPHLVLEEIGAPYRLELVDPQQKMHKSAPYLALNPNGLIPVLVHDDLVLYETAAICLHLVDTHPDAAMAPAVGTSARAHFYKWLVWMTNTLQARLIHYFYPDRLVNPGDTAAAAQVKAQAEAQVGAMLDQLDAQLARHAQPWLLGEQFSAADCYAFTLCRWTRGFARPARSLPHLAPYLQRMLARPATQRVFEQQGLALPWV